MKIRSFQKQKMVLILTVKIYFILLTCIFFMSKYSQVTFWRSAPNSLSVPEFKTTLCAWPAVSVLTESREINSSATVWCTSIYSWGRKQEEMPKLVVLMLLACLLYLADAKNLFDSFNSEQNEIKKRGKWKTMFVQCVFSLKKNIIKDRYTAK